MANFFYTDANGQKQGPCDVQQLKSLVARGIITPRTTLEMDNGRKGLAGQIPGLFPAAASPPPPPVASQAARAVPVPQSAPQVAQTISSSAIIAGIAIAAVVGIVCLAMLLSKVGGGNVTNLSLGDIVPAALPIADVAPPVLTVAERAETDKYIAQYGRGAIARYLGDLRRDENKNTDYNLVLKYLKYFVAQGADINAKDGYPLLSAVVMGNVDLVKFLISQGADLRNKNDLLCVAIGGDTELVKFFVSKGADVNAKGDQDKTPLHLAAVNGNVEVVKSLVSKGADINAKDSDGETPLHTAAANGKVDIVEFLVFKGASVNAKDRNGRTPLHTAVWNGNVEVVKFLVFQKAGVDAKDVYGRTPLDLAKKLEGLSEFEYVEMGCPAVNMAEIIKILSGGNNDG